MNSSQSNHGFRAHVRIIAINPTFASKNLKSMALLIDKYLVILRRFRSAANLDLIVASSANWGEGRSQPIHNQIVAFTSIQKNGVAAEPATSLKGVIALATTNHHVIAASSSKVDLLKVLSGASLEKNLVVSAAVNRDLLTIGTLTTDLMDPVRAALNLDALRISSAAAKLLDSVLTGLGHYDLLIILPTTLLLDVGLPLRKSHHLQI